MDGGTGRKAHRLADFTDRRGIAIGKDILFDVFQNLALADIDGAGIRFFQFSFSHRTKLLYQDG